MKQLTKEQLENEFIDSMNQNKEVYIEGTNHVVDWIFKRFVDSCCDSYADGDTCESVERTDERKYKHVVTFDMNKIVEKNNKEIAEMLSRGKIVLTDQEGKPYYINTDDVKPADIIAK